MKSFFSKIATSLIAPVIIAASCLTCFSQPISVQAANVHTPTMSAEQHKHCETENHKPSKPQTAECHHVQSLANLDGKSIQIADIHFVETQYIPVHEFNSILSFLPHTNPPLIYLSDQNILTGTTIKKE
ncbi:MAG: hypothetical protein WCK01_01465 [Candidatus Uhrbacteria bacterium]